MRPTTPRPRRTIPDDRSAPAGAAGEARCQALLQHVSDAVAIYTADGWVRYISPAVETMTGYSPAEIRATRHTDWIHPDDRPRYTQFLGALAGTTAARPRLEFRYRHADGSWHVMEMVGDNQLANPRIAGLGVDLTRFRGDLNTWG